MEKITLFHGSTNIIEKPKYGEGKPYNDYGRGFYCTEHAALAKEWGCNEGTDGFVNRYELDLTNLKVLNFSDEKYTVLNWLAVLMENRIGRFNTPIERQGREYLLTHFLPSYKDADVIIGYRADDSYFSFAKAFVANRISLKQLSYAMSLGSLGIQFVLMSEKAFNQIRFEGYEIADNSEYYPRRKARDENAREAFTREYDKDDIEGIFMRDIIREKMEASDERLQREIS